MRQSFAHTYACMSAFIIHGYFFYAGYINASRVKEKNFSHVPCKTGIHGDSDITVLVNFVARLPLFSKC